MIKIIDQIKINPPVILAPMSGVTDKPFRSIVRQFGAPLLVTEMVASKSMILKTRQSMQKCSFDHEGGLTSVQLAGCEPEDMAEAAKINEDMGAALIDINFGCPAKKIVNSYSGSHLMRDECKAAKILEATVNAVKIPVTLKMRMGWDHNSLNAPKLAKIAENLGIKMITVHGRTRCQFYSGSADWEFIKKVKDNISIPLVVNGDVKEYDDATNALNLSGADGVMIGRGAYGKPWIINNIAHFLKTGEKLPSPDLKKRLEIVLHHYDKTLSYYGIDTGMMMSRKHLAWYSSALPGSASYRAKINTVTDYKEVIQYTKDFYQSAMDQNIIGA